ncbi:hypothetical protein PMAYCL1PPCAC_13725, partial [Pristionchus mayeri]
NSLCLALVMGMALEARVKQLLALDENKKCADCGTRSPRWASYSLGIFVCLQCAGFHRALGVHISRVKSCDLDRWNEDQVRAMEAVGNARGREEYGPSYAEVNNTTYLPDAQSLESFIRSKYVRRVYAKGGFGASFSTQAAAAAAAGSAPARRPQMAVYNEDLWEDYSEPVIDTTSKIRIDWPRKPAASAVAATAAATAVAVATTVKAQKEPSLIDLFEPAPVPIVQQMQLQPAAAAAPIDFFADFAAAPTAGGTAAAAVSAADPFGIAETVAVSTQQNFASFPMHQPQQHLGGFPLQQLQQPPQLSFDDDFGDFIGASAAEKKPHQVQQTAAPMPSLFGDDSENVPPPLPPKDYDPFESIAQPLTRHKTAPASASSAQPLDDSLAGLFAPAMTLSASASLTPTASASAPVAPASPRMSTADILSLYGTRSGGAQQPAVPSFVPSFGGGSGTSWA